MYEKHFNLDQLPFSIAPDPSFLYLSSAHREALAHLMYGFSHGGFVMVTGEVGTGKTTLLRNLVKQTPPDLDVAFILNPRLTVRELLASLCDELGIAYDPDSTASVKQYVDLITRHLLETHRAGRSTVMIIDEAQNLSPAVLEQVRLLTNLETDERKLLRIILIGQPELKEMLERQDLRQLAQRITARYHLGSLNREDTYAYIMHRMSRAGGNPHAFSSAALRRIYSLSKGTPRLINVIADRALLGAYTLGRHQVTARVVSRAAREVLGQKPDRRAWWIGAATALFAAGAAWAILVPLGGKLPVEQKVIDRGAAAEPATAEQAAPELAKTAADREAAADPTPSLANERPGQTAQVAAAPEEQQGALLFEPAKEAPAEVLTPEGEEIITPQTYARMQADALNQAESGPTLNPQSVPDAGNARATSTISRPAGSNFSNQRLAYAAVFERWGVAYNDQSSEQIPCDFAPSAGLQCLTERGDWSQIAQLDLPVILELWDGRPRPYHAALLGMEGGRILLGIGNETVETTQRALRDQWAGSFVVLWQTPPGYYGSLRSGQQHETVGWLRLQLGSLVDRSLASPTPNLFDENLQQAVLEFQTAEGLTADGIVGPATWIRLATRLNLPQPSLDG
jgi:general secretion pathway protein A